MALNGITLDTCVAQRPGIGLLSYAPVSDLDPIKWPAAIKDSTYNQQSGAGEVQWYSMPYLVGTGAWTENQQDDPQGQYFRNELTLLLPNDSAAIRRELQAMKDYRFILKMTKGTSTWLLGTISQPLRFSSSYESGADGEDQRGHRCQFSGAILYKSPYFIPVF